MKTCANPLCATLFDGANPRKKYCSVRCKNQTAHKDIAENYKHELQLQRGRWKNIRILEKLNARKFEIVTIEELNSLGFNFRAAYMPDKTDSGQNVWRFGNIYLIQLNKGQYKLKRTSDDH